MKPTRFLFRQTGLSKAGVDALKSTGRQTLLLTLQERFFTPVEQECAPNTIVSWAEHLAGEEKSGQEIPVVEEGDILINFNCHFFGWRNGHAAIVIDAERGITLEAALWGKPSEKMRMRHWSSYANAVHLRVSEEAAASALAASGIARDTSIAASAQLGCLAAAFAEEYENGVMYGLFSGIPDKAPAPSAFEKTQCAHLVWYAYKQFGLDLDADGSWLVTPRDIAKSDKLVVIEAFGDYEY